MAYEFYKKHPKETLIVVTADHETGGMSLGTGRYELRLKALTNQEQSQDLLSKAITDLRKDSDKASWEEVKALLADKMGFWEELPLTWEQEKMLRDEYETSFVKNKVVFEESLYAKTEPLAAAARKSDEPDSNGRMDRFGPYGRICTCLCNRCGLRFVCR